MSKYFKINGFFKEDKSEFSDYIVKEFDDVEKDENRDDMIFFYGLSETEIQEAIAEGDSEKNMLDFVVTSYEEIEF